MSLRTPARILAIAGLAFLIVPRPHPLFAQSAPYEIAAASDAPAINLPASATTSSDPSLTDSLHALTASFEPGASEEYTIGDGDEIHLDVSGRPELTSNYTLGPDGRITIPSVGSVQISGLTREQAATAVQNAMQPFYKDPAVTVGVVRYLSNQVLLLGAVKNPGMQSFDEQPTLLQVLSRGGIGADSGIAGGPGTAGGSTLPDRAFIYRGSQELAVVDLKRLLSGSAFADLRLRRNDIVMVPVENQIISILGAVRTPGAIRYGADSTLQVLLAQAGGLDAQAGSNPLIQIIDLGSGTSTQVRFNQLLDPRHGSDISLHAGDVIFVPSSEFAKFAYVVDKLNPITTVVALTAVAAR